MAAANREAMLETGEELFLRAGVAATGLKVLLDEVNLSKGAFYHHFSSKDDFAAAVLARQVERRRLAMREMTTASPGLDGVVGWFAGDLAAMQGAGWVPRCLAARLAVEAAAGRLGDAVHAAMDGLVEELATAVEAGQEAGSIYDGVEASSAARHLLDLWAGACARARVEHGPEAPRAALEHMAAWMKP